MRTLISRNSRRDRKRRGVAVVAVLMTILVLSTCLSVTCKMSLQRIHMAKRLGDGIRALAIAEAGAAEAFAILTTNFLARTNQAAFPPTDYAGGSYDVSTIPLDIGDENLCIVVSTGFYGVAMETVILDVKGDIGGPDSPPDNSAWEKTIYCGSEMTVNGNGDIDGEVHSNSKMTFNGNLDFGPESNKISSVDTMRINGNILSPGTLQAPEIIVAGNNESGADIVEAAVPPIDFPSLDLTPYYQIAQANGMVMDGGIYNNDYDWTDIPGGVIWINGDITIGGNMWINGIIIATGNIWIRGSVVQNMSETLGEGGVVSRDGNVKISGGHNAEGLVYCPGDVTLEGNIDLLGQIVVGGEVDLNGNIGIVDYKYSPLALGMPYEGNPTEISAWQK